MSTASGRRCGVLPGEPSVFINNNKKAGAERLAKPWIKLYSSSFVLSGPGTLPGSDRFWEKLGQSAWQNLGLSSTPDSLVCLSWSFLLCGRFQRKKLEQSSWEVLGSNSTPAGKGLPLRLLPNK
jgi:hypothetical protein